MSIYSSAFDPRHYRDNDAINVAFLEFIVGLIFGHPIRVAAGSFFDCLPLHSVWCSFYPSFKLFPELYSEYGLRPLTIVIDKNRYPYSSDDNIACKVAHDFLSGRVTDTNGGPLNIESDSYEFSILDTDEVDNVRAAGAFADLRRGKLEALESIRNELFIESLKELNSYCNRFKPYEFVVNETHLDILDHYMRGCLEIAAVLSERRPEIARELREGVRTIAATPKHLRESTATLIRTAREHFPTTFDPVVVPLSRALSSQLTANNLQANMSTNYEVSRIADPVVFEAACEVAHRQRPALARKTQPGKRIKLTSSSYKGKLATVFEWNAFHNVLFQPECQARIQAIKLAETGVEKQKLLDRHAKEISKELIDILSLRVEYTDTDNIYVAVDVKHKEPGAFKNVLKIADKLIDYVPIDVGKDVLLRAIRSKAMKEGLSALCAVSGGI